MSKNSKGRERVINILMRREGVSREEATEMLDETMDMVYAAIANGEDGEDVFMDELGLEPDYLLDMLV